MLFKVEMWLLACYLGRCPLFFGISADKKCTTHAPIKKTTIKQRNTKNAFEKSKNI